MKKAAGFTLIETVVALTIFSLIGGTIIYYINNDYKNNQARQLADQSIGYAKYFATYIINNESAISSQITANGSVAISYANLASPGDLPAEMSGINFFGQIPCVVVIKNVKSNSLLPMLFYVTAKPGYSADITTAQKAAVMLGGKGGYLNDQNIVQSAGGWSIESDSPYLANSTTCGGVAIAPHSVFLNLALSPDYNKALQDNLSLSRLLDNTTPAGDPRNKNTAKTDLTLASIDKTTGTIQSHAINFDYNSQATLGINPNNSQEVVVNNGDFAADKLQASQKALAGSSCNSSEVGQIASQYDQTSANYGFQQANVICEYNPAVCQAQSGNDYCYIAIKDNVIKFTNNGSMPSSFICPAEAPVATDGAFNDSSINIQYRVCTANPSTADCSNGEITNESVDIGGSGQFISAPINVAGNNFSIQVGYQANTITPNLSCANLCTDLGASQHTSSTPPNVIDATCACMVGNPYSNNYAVYSVLSNAVTTTSSIKYVTCSSKMVLSQQ